MKFIYTLIMALFSISMNASADPLESSAWIENRTWEIAFNSGDSSALSKLYTSDAVVVPPSLEIFNDQEQIRKYWAEQMTGGTDNFRLQTINLSVEDDVVYQTAVWVATRTSNGVATDLDGEMTNVIARQQDGSWKIRLQSWN